MIRKTLGLCTILFALSVLTISSTASAAEKTASARSAADMDWTFWRGPEMNGVSRETGLVDKWNPKGKNLLWKNEALAGRSTPIVMNGRLYTMVRHKPGTEFEAEKVVCANAVTGKVLWENRFNVFLSDVPNTRVGWSNVTGDPTTGNVYAFGVCDYFQCIDGKTGKTIWARSLSEQFGALNTYGGRTNTPVIHGDLVIISSIVIGWGDMAKPAHRFLAFDKLTGRTVWFNSTRLLPYDTNYSSPTTTVIDGQAMMIVGSGDGGVHALQPRTGKRIWTYNISRRGLDMSPLVVGNTVYAGHSEENIGDNSQGAMAAIDATGQGDISKTGARWMVKSRMVGKSSAIPVDGKLVVVEDGGRMFVVDPQTGKIIARRNLGIMMRGSPLYADGKIYACTVNGLWHVLKLNGNRLKTVHRMRTKIGKVYSSPIVSHGRIYLQTFNAMFCIGTRDSKPSAAPRPTPPREAPVDNDRKPTLVQVDPVESLVKPGEQIQFQTKLFNASGQLLEAAPSKDVVFSLDGPGSIDAQGTYHAPANARQPAAIIVTAKVGTLSGQARIRMVPKFPLQFDFNDGQIPITWVGARYRHVPLDIDLYQSLKKQDKIAADLYLYLTSSFVNSGRSKLRLDNSARRKQWRALLIYLGHSDDNKVVNNLAGAKAFLDPSLAILKKERLLDSWQLSEWTADGLSGIRLSVVRGPRRTEGNGVMTKIRTIPLGASSRCWMGHDSHHNYTIKADVMGNIVDGKIPDIGLIGHRYVLDMMGSTQQLQIRTWSAELRMAKTVSFQWKPNVWYTMKFRAAIENGKAVLKGKVWPRSEDEPRDWMVEAVDESPNMMGSPGLFGNARNAEIFLDNITITNNDAG